jgi:hypothetical protein
LPRLPEHRNLILTPFQRREAYHQIDHSVDLRRHLLVMRLSVSRPTTILEENGLQLAQ